MPQLFCSFHTELAVDLTLKGQEGFLEEELLFVDSEEAEVSTQQNTGCPAGPAGGGRASTQRAGLKTAGQETSMWRGMAAPRRLNSLPRAGL